MIYSVSDFATSYEDHVRLVAGAGGLSRAISQVGILDYELVPGLKSRYQRVNFEPGQLVLSTFLYAKDDPWLVGEAVKYLVGKGTSGLVIKNVFHLEVPDSALRYAEARDYPLFYTTDDDFFFDLVIAEVDQRVAELADASFAQNELDLMLAPGTSNEEVRAHALKLNPSFKEEYVAIYAAEPLSSQGLAAALERYHGSELDGLGNLFVVYDGGLLYIASAPSDILAVAGGDARLVDILRADVLEHEVSAAVGVSDVHYGLVEMGHAVLEARRAAAVAAYRKLATIRYADLGVMRALLPFAESPEMSSYSSDVLEPIRDFDAETGSSLLETLDAYCACAESVDETAKKLGQHPNTVRYRLGKVASITGLSYKKRAEMEQLSIACKIELCRELLREA